MSTAKLSKLENNRVPASVADVERILTALEVPDPARTRFLDLARSACSEQRAWSVYRRLGFHKKQREIAAIEAQATDVRVMQAAMIPGLLQSEDYVRSIFSGDASLSEGERERTIKSRLQRQGVLHDHKKNFYFLLTESALRWTTLPKASMAAQINHIISLSSLSNVAVGIIPLNGVKKDFPISSFCIFDRRLVTIEAFHAEISTRDPRDIDLHIGVFNDFSSHALGYDASREELRSISGEYFP